MNVVANEIKNVYFLGIGGIGMSALARYFKFNGYHVAGYDRTCSPLTEKMRREEGIATTHLDEVVEIEDSFRDPARTLVIYTPAIPSDCKQLNFFRNNGFDLRKRAEVLGWISQRGKAICIAGTHGKTTVSTWTAFLLHQSKVGCNAFLGGISLNFDSNILLNSTSPYVVIEADEFDRSFLHLTPTISLITSMDEDHLDIYQNKANLFEAFEAFAQKTVTGGCLFVKQGLQLKFASITGNYALEAQTDYYADRLRMEGGCYVFDYHGKGVTIENLQCGIPGRLNVENAVAAITLALEAGVSPEEIRIALPKFRGIARRFNIHINEDQRVFIDDYAHHPREIEATLKSIREMWPDKPLTVVFQPHLYTRTRDFQVEFAESLNMADRVLLLDIYPARELPIVGVSAESILHRLSVPSKVVTKEAVVHYAKHDFQSGILVTMGAGDVEHLVPRIKEALSSE